MLIKVSIYQNKKRTFDFLYNKYNKLYPIAKQNKMSTFNKLLFIITSEDGYDKGKFKSSG